MPTKQHRNKRTTIWIYNYLEEIEASTKALTHCRNCYTFEVNWKGKNKTPNEQEE